jgi:hypothetical protein
VNADNQATLKQLASPDFDPHQLVLVADSIPAATAPDTRDPGPVSITHYSPRKIQLVANPSVPSVLLLNDHFDPAWTATIDGKPERILRANSVVRGLYLTPGKHQIEFMFAPSTPGLYPTLAGWLMALALVALVSRTPATAEIPAPPPGQPAPAPADKKKNKPNVKK